MKFGEDFPSLKGKVEQYSSAPDKVFCDDVKNNCLDKQKVKEAIDKFSDICYYSPHICDTPDRSRSRKFKEQIELLKKELGL